MRVQHGFALTNLPSAAEIATAIEATGAKEVALFHGGAEPLAALCASAASMPTRWDRPGK
jgi:hypothetical protein